MAELLVKATKTTYDIGDIISVEEDGFNWGNSECAPSFIVVQIEGSKEDNLYLLEASHNGKYLDEEGNEQTKLIKKRKYSVDIDKGISKNDKKLIETSDWYVPKLKSTIKIK